MKKYERKFSNKITCEIYCELVYNTKQNSQIFHHHSATTFGSSNCDAMYDTGEKFILKVRKRIQFSIESKKSFVHILCIFGALNNKTRFYL